MAAEPGTDFSYEIIVGDDASTDVATVYENQFVNQLPHCRLWISDRNLGRAALRNRLADMATHPYLIYIDSDAKVEREDYLRRYVEAVRKARVVVGGVRNVFHQPSPDVSLRFRYEARADKHRSASCRARTPYLHFSTFNFLIERELMCKVRFNEECLHYGYEDAYLGMELKQRRIKILHIDNELVHLGLDTNVVFLQKSETALRTLYGLDEAIRHHASVSRVAERLERWQLMPVVHRLFRLFGASMRRCLLGKKPCLLLFSLYKLGYYSSLSQQASEKQKG